jgi:hypothetical protein
MSDWIGRIPTSTKLKKNCRTELISCRLTSILHTSDLNQQLARLRSSDNQKPYLIGHLEDRS